MFPLGQLVPNLAIEGTDGHRHALWDFRQKSHVVLLRGFPEKSMSRWSDEARARRSRLDWLNVTLAFSLEPSVQVGQTIELIDRYGRLQRTLANLPCDVAQAFDEIENDFLYYEARHC